ncbi:MAG: HEAT repeat domain-containing protein [Planctomycetes bacterium]|nr:HEAT repeat domain-containing protein [Planctomycetota bacterium]
MSKTILIVIGIACALLTATGIMYQIQHTRDRFDGMVKLCARLKNEVATGQKSIAEVRELLNDKNRMVRLSASGVLFYDLKDKKSLPELRKLLRDKDIVVRMATLNGLMNMGDKESIPEIRNLLDDSAVYSIAAEALGKLGDKESIPKIRKQLNDEFWLIRATAIKALVNLDDKDSIPQIKELLKDKDEQVRYDAEQALKQLGVPEAEIKETKESKTDNK